MVQQEKQRTNKTLYSSAWCGQKWSDDDDPRSRPCNPRHYQCSTHALTKPTTDSLQLY